MQLTVVMSVLNGGIYLRNAVESILNQTHKDFTFIVINNGSTDETETILEAYARHDERLKVLHKPKTVDLAEARNEGVKRANTEWVAFMNADDISERERFERQIPVIAQYDNRLGALGTWARYINENGEIIGQRIMEPITLEKFTEMFDAKEAIVPVDPSVILHRPTFLSIGGLRPESYPPIDLDLYYRIAEYGRAVLVMPEFLLRFRLHWSSDSARNTMLQRQKTHFVNFNMRRRRSELDEISWEDYVRYVWASPRYRIARLRTDAAMMLYRRAGLCYVSRRYDRFIGNMIAAGLLNPRFVLKRLFRQKVPYVGTFLSRRWRR